MSDAPARVGSHLALVRVTAGNGTTVGLVALTLATALVEAGVLLLLLPVVASLTGATTSLPLVGEVAIAAAVALLAVAVLARAALQWVSAVLSTRIRLEVMDTLRLDALQALFGADWGHVASHRRSHVVQSLTSEVLRAGSAVDLMVRLLAGTLVLLGTAGVLLVLDLRVGLLGLAALLLVAAVALPTLRSATRLGVSFGERVHAFGALVTDSLASLRLIRAHDAADRWTALVEREAAAGRAVQLRYAATTAAVRSGLGVLAAALTVALVLLGREWGMGAAALVVLAAATIRLLMTLQGLVTMAQQLRHLAPALDRITALTHEARLRPEQHATTAVPADPTAPLVELRDVRVLHEGTATPALDGVSLVLPREGVLLVTGPSGAGKSTLLDVVLGLLRPTTGEVLVEGAPLADVRRWRARLGYVAQETVLIPGTVRENLTWSAPAVPDDDTLWAALEDACLADVVRALPAGLDTDLHDFTRLSGGEQQRLSLARALVRGPDLLVLDEATSALDVDTEGRVLARVRARGGAVLMVSHREATAGAVDGHLRLG